MSDYWPCGHPRSVENSQRVGKAGVRCRICRRWLARKWDAEHRGVPYSAEAVQLSKKVPVL